ncbi:MAG: hypothetical protein OEY17_05600 [Nitrosopumilus sp.]|nr:hypothetical protein [Nitrosopumilus sp.]MDH5658797.1 hypothetical protein [Nitrosopumilus sp.]
MSANLDAIIEILNGIKDELTNLISLGKNTEKTDSRLSSQTTNLNKAIHTSEISEKDKTMLEKFALTLQEGTTVKSLRYEKQDLERILANLND